MKQGTPGSGLASARDISSASSRDAHPRATTVSGASQSLFLDMTTTHLALIAERKPALASLWDISLEQIALSPCICLRIN